MLNESKLIFDRNFSTANNRLSLRRCTAECSVALAAPDLHLNWRQSTVNIWIGTLGRIDVSGTPREKSTRDLGTMKSATGFSLRRLRIWRTEVFTFT